MAYAHLVNLYKDQTILLYREVYSLEKIHGESAHMKYVRGIPELDFFAGNSSLVNFRALFDIPRCLHMFESLGCETATVHGEVHGGSIQKSSAIYGTQMAFAVFDIEIGGMFVDVPTMADLATQFGLEVVPWKRIPCTQEAIDAERDAPSLVSVRRGVAGPKPREGVVLRPLVEMLRNGGERVTAKHKTDKHLERATPQKVEDLAKLKVLSDAKAIAEEWVTEMRLQHVVSKLPHPLSAKDTPLVLRAMEEDVVREAEGEIVVTREALTAIGRKTAELFKKYLVG